MTLAERRAPNSCGPSAPQSGPRRRGAVVGAHGPRGPATVAPAGVTETASLSDPCGLARTRTRSLPGCRADVCPNRATPGRRRPNLARGPNVSEHAEHPAKIGHLAPEATKFARQLPNSTTSPGIDQPWPGIDQPWPGIGQLGHMRPSPMHKMHTAKTIPMPPRHCPWQRQGRQTIATIPDWRTNSRAYWISSLLFRVANCALALAGSVPILADMGPGSAERVV